MSKTLIGKENYLFLINDSSNEIEKHRNNNSRGNIDLINLYNSYENFVLIVYPDKSIIYQKYLPDYYKSLYRTIFESYKNILKNKILDPYTVLVNEKDTYYKTDTHINLKGNYLVYNYFINHINYKLKLDLPLIDLNNLNKKLVSSLSLLCLGIGDLTWESNLCNQKIDDMKDNYYSDNINEIKYNIHYIKKDDIIKLIDDKDYLDHTDKNIGKLLNWEIISKYIIYRLNENCNNNFKVIIFYDSFMAFSLHLYMNLFKEIYFIKNIFDVNHINFIKPDYIFEFRVERFLF